MFVRSLWYEFTTSPWGHSVVTLWCHRYMRWLHHHEVTVLSQCDVTDIWDDHIIMRSQCCHRTMLTMWDHYNGLMISKLWHHKFEMFVRSQWYRLSTLAWGHSVVTVWCHRYTRWAHHLEDTVVSQYDVTGNRDECDQCDVTDIRDDHIIMRSQCCHRTMLTMWDRYDINIVTSPLWDVCEVTVIQVEHITMMSQYCHNMMSQIHKMTTSPWGHSVVTVWCHRYMRWPHHHEFTVLSQDDAHHVRSLWYQNYDITSVMFLWGHSDTSWAHHLEVTVLSQYDVTDTKCDHMTMRSQCCHMTMLTLWGLYDVLMISKLWHHMCQMFVTSQWQMFTT